MFTIAEVIKWCDGKIIGRVFDTTAQCGGVSIDTRTIKRGEVFFALKGEKSDGHEHVANAFKNGAPICVVEKETGEGVQILVPDVLKALQKCAKEYRKKFNMPVVGVTGSNGKTTTKNMIAAVLSTKYKVCSTAGNLNNHIGVPLSILTMKNGDQAAVFEAGMNHPGEIAQLAEIISPTIVVVTGIGLAHIEAFEHEKNPEEAIAREKSQLVKSLVKHGTIILPAKEKYKDLISTYSPSSKLISVLPDEKLKQKLINNKFVYATASHMIQNALLAIAVGKELGIEEDVSIKAICSAEYEEGRFTERDVSGMNIIDDTYNANPDSVCAAIKAMTEKGGRKIVVLGALKEQGKALNDGYQKIYDTAVEFKVEILILCGIEWSPLKNIINTIHVSTHAECASKIKEIYKTGDVVLLKGSKSSEMKKVITLL